MTTSPLRYKRLIQEIPRHIHVKDALLASGFSEKTALKSSKRVIVSALKYQAREILSSPQETKPLKVLMTDLLGLSSGDLFYTLKKIALQDKDYGSALKVLGPLAKEHGINLSQDEGDKVSVPILNVIVERNEPINMAKNIEPPIDND